MCKVSDITEIGEVGVDGAEKVGDVEQGYEKAMVEQ